MADVPPEQGRIAECFKPFDRERTLKYLIRTAQPVIFDVGANDGASLDEFKAWWPEARVHCFEPQEECWVALDQRRSRYGEGEIHINKVAAGNRRSDRATFYTHDVSSEISGFNRVNLQSADSIHLNRLARAGDAAVHEYRTSMNHARSVSVVRLDEYLDTCGVQHVDLVKVDTQGYEPEVLEGFGQRLRDVDVIVAELMFYDYYERSVSFSDVERFLIPAGFRLYDISHIAKNEMNGRTDWVDVIYVNNRARA